MMGELLEMFSSDTATAQQSTTKKHTLENEKRLPHQRKAESAQITHS